MNAGKKAANIAFLIFAACSLAGCNAGGPWKPPPPVTPRPAYALTKNEMAEIQATILYHLKDPDSAKLRNVAAVKLDDGSLKICGEVNSRNSFGGYTGFMPFSGTVTNGKFQLQLLASTDEEVKFVVSNCRFTQVWQ